ncbi:hypothetical protein [Neptuniibacter sp.]|uniref:hypothetical protein n=1 Tax=Neptuniibacter sp. TaxID=1962643 RepID=UPI003B597963
MRRNFKKGNEIVLEQLGRVNRAVAHLDELKLTVLKVDLSQHIPVIEVQKGRACEAMETGSVTRYRTKEGIRVKVEAAQICNCYVLWEDAA